MTVYRTASRAAVAIVLVSAASCSPAAERATERPAERATERATGDRALSVAIGGGRLSAPDSVPAGWTRLAFRATDADDHLLVAFRLPPGMTPAAFIAELRAHPDRTTHATAVGGPELPTSAISLRLRPGMLVVACLGSGEDDQPHAARGEWQAVHVSAPALAADTGTAPSPTVDVRMVDFAYPGATEWPADRQLLALHNDGATEHHLLIYRLHGAHTAGDLVASRGADSVGTFVDGASRLAPGETVYLATTLAAGRYAIICALLDPRTGRPHVLLGMSREIRVGPAGRPSS